MGKNPMVYGQIPMGKNDGTGFYGHRMIDDDPMAKIQWDKNVQCGAPQLCVLVYKPHEYYSYIGTINHSEIGVINQLSYLGGPTLVVTGWY